MATKQKGDSRTAALRRIALRCPEVEEGIACKGTALECAAFKARKKTFLFLGAAEIKVKLNKSLNEAAKFEAKDAGCCKVGANGWVAVYLDSEHCPPLDVLQRWIDESYRLNAPESMDVAKNLKSNRVSKRKS